MKLKLIIVSLLLFTTSFSENKNIWLTDYDQALLVSKKKQIPILINFSGSDWCQPCMLLSRTIFETSRFHLFAKDSLVLLNLDFPRKRKNMPSNREMVKREKLAAKYNKKGTFPAVILINHKGDVLAETGYKRVSANQYIRHIKNIVKHFYRKGAILNNQLEMYQKTRNLMGSKFQISAVHHNQEFALSVIDSAYKEIQRIESLISSWEQDSQTTLINKNAGILPVVVDLELFNLIKRAKKVSVITEGAFDISYAAMDNIWNFNHKELVVPPDKIIREAVKKVNYRNIILNNTEKSVFLTEKGMKIGFGAIGKGYAANMARHLMIQMGIENGMVNAGGDLIVWGISTDNKKWKVGIADPKKKNKFISWLELKDQAIVTSGDYERYVIIDGVRYSHIIDPRTGYPARGIKSVTIICPDTELADALATSVFVLGVEKGLRLINQMKGFECIIVNDSNKFITSKGIELNLMAEKRNKS